jgi:transposase
MLPAHPAQSDAIAELKRIIAAKDALIARQATIITAKNELITEKDTLIAAQSEDLRLLRQALFGRSSEKISAEEIRQSLLFNEIETYAAGERDEVRTTVKKHARSSKGGRKGLPAHLPRVQIPHDLSEEERAGRRHIGDDTRELLVIVPPKVYVERHVYPKYALPENVLIEGEPGVKSAQRPPELIPGGVASSGLLAYVLTGKFCDHLPFFRIARIFLRYGVELKRATLCNWTIFVARRCEPLIELMWRHALSGPLIACDETTVQVLDEPGRKNSSQSYMWLMRGGPPGKPALLFDYQPTRAAGFLEERLRDREYRGVLLSDGYEAYGALARTLKLPHAGCWDHARRKFVDLQKAAPGSRAARGVLRLLGGLYHVEAEARRNNLSPDQLLAERQKKSARRLRYFKRWLDRVAPTTPPKSRLGLAVNYTLAQWSKLTMFLGDTNVPIANILVENAVRPFAIGRKNWMFSGSPRGARASAVLYSLIETAKANGLEPYEYLRYLFEKLPMARSEADLTALLPWNLTPELIKAFLTTLPAPD